MRHASFSFTFMQLLNVACMGGLLREHDVMWHAVCEPRVYFRAAFGELLDAVFHRVGDVLTDYEHGPCSRSLGALSFAYFLVALRKSAI